MFYIIKAEGITKTTLRIPNLACDWRCAFLMLAQKCIVFRVIVCVIPKYDVKDPRARFRISLKWSSFRLPVIVLPLFEKNGGK